LCNFISTPPADSQSWRGRRPTPAVCYLLRRPVLPPLLRPFAAFFPRSYRPRQPSLVDNSMSIERRRKASPIIGQRCGQRRPPLEMSSPGMHKETKQQWASPSVQSDSPADFEIIGIWFGYILTGLSWFIVAITFPFSMCFCLKVVKEYERVLLEDQALCLLCHVLILIEKLIFVSYPMPCPRRKYYPKIRLLYLWTQWSISVLRIQLLR
ncbi:Protein unc-1, partial [Trichinella pseudospiralis]